MLTCREATERLSESQDRPLSAGETLGLKVHLAVCKSCRRTGQQMALLRRFSRQYTERSDALPPEPRDGA
ncbi:zf-HC2 domain-containing protein [Amphibiibacter pelophylacis]|uniref:Zf-HC2 domain-containing protein n=1 Tax=Amphibiibacter pelophylacis TaxID=1799477 RepID=A0ACC6NYJ8_9BURK